jgi:uroporphyrin-III C-methyltransferase
MTGKVYLVGAGPGDPELLTLKAARLLKQADVVLHDDLIGKRILGLIPSHAQVVNVGKRCGQKGAGQDEINFLMVTLAVSGFQVIRLKGGDPLIFGRAGEEIAALRRANIEFEIIPGITAAMGAASAAQIPLTDRHSAHAVVFLTGHTTHNAAPTNWRALVSLRATIVVYMPGREYTDIAGKLQDAGLSEDTSCAVISRATTAEEQVYATSLKDLGDAPQLPAPTLLVIGEVLRHAGDRFSPEQIGPWNCWPSRQSSFEMTTPSPRPESNQLPEIEEREA